MNASIGEFLRGNSRAQLVNIDAPSTRGFVQVKHRPLENRTCFLLPSRPTKCFVFEREKKKSFTKTCLVLLAGKFEGALSGDKYEVFYRTVYIDSVLVGLVGTTSTSNFPVVYG